MKSNQVTDYSSTSVELSHNSESLILFERVNIFSIDIDIEIYLFDHICVPCESIKLLSKYSSFGHFLENATRLVVLSV